MNDPEPRDEKMPRICAWLLIGIGGILSAASQSQPWAADYYTRYDFNGASPVLRTLYFLAFFALLGTATIAAIVNGTARHVLTGAAGAIALGLWSLIIAITHSVVVGQAPNAGPSSLAAGAGFAIGAAGCVALALVCLLIPYDRGADKPASTLIEVTPAAN